MRRAFCVAILMLLIWTSVVVAEEKVFRNLSWGDPVDALGHDIRPGPDLFGSDSGVEFWVVPDCDLQLGPLRAQEIFFGFFQNRLITIMIVTMSYQASIVHRLAEEKYGQSLHQDAAGTYYVHGDTFCLVSETGETAAMCLSSLSIEAERRDWMQGGSGYKDAY